MATTAKRDRRRREERLGVRVDGPTKALIERAAELERRKLTDFCMTVLTDAARRTIAEHETLGCRAGSGLLLKYAGQSAGAEPAASTGDCGA